MSDAPAALLRRHALSLYPADKLFAAQTQAVIDALLAQSAKPLCRCSNTGQIGLMR